MKTMQVLVRGTSGQQTKFTLTVEHGLVLEIIKLPEPIGAGNPPSWEAWITPMVNELYSLGRCSMEDVLVWRDYYVRVNAGSKLLADIHIYEI